ncbi:MAG: hypothetical protein HUJ95_01860, partial [Bacteroidales bacterium]|nr:hypothetical protein [Bacteroidales bacterium]
MSGTFDSRREAEVWAREVRVQYIANGKKRIPTLSEAIDEYIETRSNILSPATIRGYRIIQRARFTEYMPKPVNAPVDWQRAVNDEVKLCSPKTLKNA